MGVRVRVRVRVGVRVRVRRASENWRVRECESVRLLEWSVKV